MTTVSQKIEQSTAGPMVAIYASRSQQKLALFVLSIKTTGLQFCRIPPSTVDPNIPYSVENCSKNSSPANEHSQLPEIWRRADLKQTRKTLTRSGALCRLVLAMSTPRNIIVQRNHCSDVNAMHFLFYHGSRLKEVTS